MLGKLSSEEEGEVREQMAVHSEIAEEVERIELDLEAFDRMQAVQPPSEVLDGIRSRINPNAAPSTGLSGNSINWLIGVALVLTGISAGYFFLQSMTKSEDIRTLNEELTQLRTECAEQAADNTVLAAQLAAIQSAVAQMIVLGGSELSPNSTARVFLNPQEKVIYLGGVNLPAPPTGKQYQLWALVDGQPVDMGVFDVTPDSIPLRQLPYVPGAGAFAVTLEDEGGRPTPNLNQLYLISKFG